MLGLRFCARASSSCGKWGPLFIAGRGPFTITASLVAEHRLQTRRLSSCGSRAQLLRGMRDLPRPGLEPVSPALAGRFSTTAPPGKPSSVLFNICYTAFRESNCKESSSQAKGRDSLPTFFFLLKSITLGRKAALSKCPESFSSHFYILKFMVQKNF